MAETGSAFRALHGGPGAFVIPNPSDIGMAKLLASLGFKALATTSAGYAFTRGLADGDVGFEPMIAHCREIAAATDLPVSADLEKGKGDSPDSASETIFAAEAAGLAGCSIEDHTGDPGDPIYDFGQAVERVSAAVEAARSLKRDFVFTARAENHLWGRNDLDDTIRRLQAFEKAGADVLFAPGLPSLDAVRQVCAAVSRPVNFMVGIPGRSFSVAELANAGVTRISLASSLHRAAMTGMMQAASEVLEKGTFTYLDALVSGRDMTRHFSPPR